MGTLSNESAIHLQAVETVLEITTISSILRITRLRDILKRLAVHRIVHLPYAEDLPYYMFFIINSNDITTI